MSATTPQIRKDIEGGRILRDGYPGLSTWISGDPDHEGFIFRRFSRLSARNLLNLQSQLISIENELENLDQESRKLPLDIGLRRWETFEHQLKDPLKKLYDELEDKMKSYRESI
jgi:hypothetical protein